MKEDREELPHRKEVAKKMWVLEYTRDPNPNKREDKCSWHKCRQYETEKQAKDALEFFTKKHILYKKYRYRIIQKDE